MKKYYLDTSFIIDLINGEKEAVDIHEEIKGGEVTGTPCLYELLKFSNTLDLLKEKEIVPLEKDDATEASHIHRELRESGEPIADIDTLIVGIVINRGYTLVTRDEDFERIEGLNLRLYQV